jgi:hypothetical protein
MRSSIGLAAAGASAAGASVAGASAAGASAGGASVLSAAIAIGLIIAVTSTLNKICFMYISILLLEIVVTCSRIKNCP